MSRLLAAISIACVVTGAQARELTLTTTTDTTSVGREYTVSRQDPGLQVIGKDIELAHATGVTTISYSAVSGNFYFWLDEFTLGAGDSSCATSAKFGIPVNATSTPLIDQVKMAFLSGKQVKVTWNTGACTGGGMRPHYVKVYR